MKFTRNLRQTNNFDVVVTSMLDINFLLILFFILTAQFQRDTHARLDLPQEKGEKLEQVDEAGLVINIAANGTIIVGKQTLSLEQLRERVRAEAARRTDEPLKLMVRCDRNAASRQLNAVLNLLQESGVGTIRLGTVVPAQPRPGGR